MFVAIHLPAKLTLHTPQGINNNQVHADGDQQPLLPRVVQGVGQAAIEALQAVLGRVQALEENSSVLMNSTQQNFGLIEDKANLGEFRKLQERVHQLQTILHVRDAAETEAKENPKPKPEAKDWAAQFNS